MVEKYDVVRSHSEDHMYGLVERGVTPATLYASFDELVVGVVDLFMGNPTCSYEFTINLLARRALGPKKKSCLEKMVALQNDRAKRLSDLEADEPTSLSAAL